MNKQVKTQNLYTCIILKTKGNTHTLTRRKSKHEIVNFDLLTSSSERKEEQKSGINSQKKKHSSVWI